MTENPYAAPKAPLAAAKPALSVPEDIKKSIRGACIAGAISGCVTLAFTLLAISGTTLIGFSAWEFFDVALIFGLTFGIYKKSRVCAVLMLVYFIAAKLYLFTQAGTPSGLPLALLFGYFFAKGVYGTFRYHRLLQEQELSAVAAA